MGQGVVLIQRPLDHHLDLATTGLATEEARWNHAGIVENQQIAGLQQLDDVGKVIDAAMQSGANNINRLAFTLKDEDAARLDALKQASSKAKAKAEAIAASLGLKIVRIASVSEGERSIQPIYRAAPMARAEGLAAAAPTPIEQGTVDVTSTGALVAEVSER